MAMNWEERKILKQIQQQNNHNHSRNNHNNNRNNYKQAILLEQEKRQLNQQNNNYSTNNEQSDWLLALYWIKVDKLEMINGYDMEWYKIWKNLKRMNWGNGQQ